ncbi:MAG: type II secretion system protein GspG [Nannocystaceae bacterium]|nr:type II secretion system protein GspG [Nannocystaceae bacterium]
MKKLLSLQQHLLTRQLCRPHTSRFSARNAAGTLSRQRGMTLIEIMVVVAIISLVMGGVGLMAFNSFKQAQTDTARKDVVQIQQAVEMYRTQKRGKCPKTLQDLKASGVAAKVSKDPWGNDYEIKCPGEKTSVDVISAGPDGEVGTEDDVNNYTDEADEPKDEA